MLKKHIILMTLIGLISSFSSIALADWIPVGSGIDYSAYTIAGPVRVFVTRMSRASTNCIIDSSIAQGRLNKSGLASPRETVTGMANRYNDTINFWGEGTVNYWGNRSQVIAAINGDYWDTAGYTLPQSGQIQGGWFTKRFIEYSGGSGFVWKLNRTCFLGGNLRNGEAAYSACVQLVSFAGSTDTINSVNTTRGTNDLAIYTPQYGPNTFTNNSGVEVLVKMDRPNLPYPSGTSYARGTVMQVRRGLGSTPIPFDHVVFSGHGTKTTLLNQLSPGQEVRVYMHMRDYGTTTWIPLPNDQDWGKTYASIGGAVYCVISSSPFSDNTSKYEYTVRDPRTCVAFNATYVYFLVVDGRTANSIGMTFAELGTFCVDSLQAEFAIAEDGGGSSALWVNGEIKNHPSDGSERATNNGLMMINVLPMSKSSTVPIGGYIVTSTNNIAVRLGPGTNYDTITTLPIWTQCTILSHSLNGIYAKGKYWWKCQVGNIEGWIAEELIEFIPIELIDFESEVASHITEIKKQ
jgi:hypothetical protein